MAKGFVYKFEKGQEQTIDGFPDTAVVSIQTHTDKNSSGAPGLSFEVFVYSDADKKQLIAYLMGYKLIAFHESSIKISSLAPEAGTKTWID